MTHTQAEQVVTELMKPIFGFAKNRCSSIKDAEDISQEICLKLFRTLLVRDDIAEPEKYAWTIAHNVLANYYRSRSKYGASVPIHGFADILPTDDDFTTDIEKSETIGKLHWEIAYLSKTQRQVVSMYYFNNMRQQEIADKLSLPLGTVKWHLSSAKTELQKGMDKMRTTASELKFNPIEFDMIGTNGTAGTMGGNSVYLRSALTQNILYLTRDKAMTINDIADTLGVSPVYVENEVDFLEQNAFMIKQGKGFIANALIDVPTTELNQRISEIYDQATGTFASELYDLLVQNIKLDEKEVLCPGNDLNFALWALIPYTIVRSGEPGNAVTFEEAATIRPDGGINICNCRVKNTDAEPIKYINSIMQMGGPSWTGNTEHMLWVMDTEWGGSRISQYLHDSLNHDLASLQTFFEGPLGEDEILRMTERGYLSRKENPDGTTIDTLNIVYLSKSADKRLRSVVNSLREKYQAEFDKLKAKASSISDTPKHMKKAREYELQYMFNADGFFIIFALNKLVESGKLKLPTEEQRNSLCAVMAAWDAAASS